MVAFHGSVLAYFIGMPQPYKAKVLVLGVAAQGEFSMEQNPDEVARKWEIAKARAAKAAAAVAKIEAKILAAWEKQMAEKD